MTTFHPFGAQTYNLGTSISSTDTTILLSSFLEPVTDTPYTMILLNTTVAYGTIAPKTNQSEFISFTGITQNADGTATLTGVTRGLAKKYPFTTDASYKLPHSGQTQFIISDAPQVFEKYAVKENDENITGLWNFTQTPTGLNPGAVQDASTTVKGITKLSTAPVSPTSPISVGDNDTRVPTQSENDALVGNNTDIAIGTGNKFISQTGLQHNAEKYAVDNSGSSTAYTVALSPIPTSLTDGMVVYAKIVSANTTTTPTLNVNSLTAHTIVKGAGTALTAGDIGANSLNTFIYDLSNTRWILQSSSSIFNTTNVQIFSTPGATTWTKPSGAKFVEVWCFGGGGGGGSGKRTPTSSAAGGGGGGGGGSIAYKRFSAAALGTTEALVVGGGGAGGAAKSSDADGNVGVAGTASSFGTSKIVAPPGAGAGAGVNGTATAGAGGIIGFGDLTIVGGAGGSGFAGSGANAGVDSINLISPRGGAGANGSNSSNTNGIGGGFITYYIQAGGTAGADAVGAGAGGNGGAGTTIDANLLIGGPGGGSGAGNGNDATAGNNGGTGGAGGFPGGGGGGGGGADSTNNTSSGAGGAGATGMVVVISYL